jgi:hypothetical protein
MTADWYPAGEDRHLVLEAIDRDLERLGDLTRAYITDTTEDLSLAVARIPDESRRHDAEDILDRLRLVIATEFDESSRDESSRDESSRDESSRDESSRDESSHAELD